MRKMRAQKGKGKDIGDEEIEEQPPSPPPQVQPLKRKKRGSSSRAPPSPPPPPPSPQPSSPTTEEEEATVVGISKLVKAGMYIDYDDLSDLSLIKQLDNQGWSQFAQFKTNWYHEIVNEFFLSMKYVASSLGRPKLKFYVRGVSGYIEEDDLVRSFGLPKLGVDDYPMKNYSSNWPLEVDQCVSRLNNGRIALKPSQVYKYNLTGDQKLAYKVIMDILLPTNSGASELSSVHIFLLCALLQNVKVNLPAFILKHITHQSKKSHPYPYGMMISHLLVQKGIPVDGCYLSRVHSFGRIGTLSLVQQELYKWNGGLWAKWEVFQRFEREKKRVWEANRCSEPVAPRGWLPSANVEGSPTRSMPEPPPPVRGTEGTSSSSASRGPRRPSTAGLSHRALSEMTFDLVWRQTQFLKEVSDHLGMNDRFSFYFDDSMFTETQPPPAPPQAHAAQVDPVADAAQVDPATDVHPEASHVDPEVAHVDPEAAPVHPEVSHVDPQPEAGAAHPQIDPLD